MSEGEAGQTFRELHAAVHVLVDEVTGTPGWPPTPTLRLQSAAGRGLRTRR